MVYFARSFMRLYGLGGYCRFTIEYKRSHVFWKRREEKKSRVDFFFITNKLNRSSQEKILAHARTAHIGTKRDHRILTNFRLYCGLEKYRTLHARIKGGQPKKNLNRGKK